MRALVNASPLIFLAKLGKLKLLSELLTDFYVSSEVLEECVKRGLEYGYIEAELIRKFIRGRVRQVDLEKARKLAEKFNIHTGEASTILIAKELGIQHVIVDDRVAIKTAKVMGLKPLSTPFLLIEALRQRKLSYEDLVTCLERLIEHGYRISPTLTQNIMERAKKFK